MPAPWPDLQGTPAADCRTMIDIRQEIDRVDRALIRLLAERLTYIERAAHLKTDRAKVRDEARIADVLAKVEVACTREGFPFAIAEPVWRRLMDSCIAHEFQVFDAASPRPSKAAAAQ
jgi:isochorismate pyruvate lyase